MVGGMVSYGCGMSRKSAVTYVVAKLRLIRVPVGIAAEEAMFHH